jgi:DNA-binding transcriptional ArsR family regulator
MNKKYILVSIDDEKAKNISKVIGNKTCNKIVEILAEKEISEKEISKKLKIPINTVEYNLKKLKKAGLVEEARNFFWSVKGKKIKNYRLANKSILISPKTSNMSKIKSVAPTVVIIAIATFFIKILFSDRNGNVGGGMDYDLPTGISSIGVSSFPIWQWFLFGSLFALLIFIILRWKKL